MKKQLKYRILLCIVLLPVAYTAPEPIHMIEVRRQCSMYVNKIFIDKNAKINFCPQSNSQHACVSYHDNGTMINELAANQIFMEIMNSLINKRLLSVRYFHECIEGSEDCVNDYQMGMCRFSTAISGDDFIGASSTNKLGE